MKCATRGFHRAVDRFARIAAHAFDRVHVDDRTVVVLDHRSDEGVRDREEVQEVDRVHRVPRLGRRVLKSHERAVVADVVDQHVDASVRARARCRRGDRRRLAW